MARRYHASAYRPAPSLLSLHKAFVKALKPQIIAILSGTPFYDIHDLDPPETLGRRKLGPDEARVLDQIAMELSVAAHAAHAASAGMTKAWLEKIARDPALFFTADYPPETHDRVISEYRRVFERSGQHLEDIVGRRQIRGLPKPRPATLFNIKRAALKAAVSLARKRGRRPNVANQILSERLASLYQSFGGRIARRQRRLADAGKKKLVQTGAFYRFVCKVIGPLNAHLDQHGLPPASPMVIEKLAAKLAKGRKITRPHFVLS